MFEVDRKMVLHCFLSNLLVILTDLRNEFVGYLIDLEYEAVVAHPFVFSRFLEVLLPIAKSSFWEFFI